VKNFHRSLFTIGNLGQIWPRKTKNSPFASLAQNDKEKIKLSPLASLAKNAQNQKLLPLLSLAKYDQEKQELSPLVTLAKNSQDHFFENEWNSHGVSVCVTYQLH